MAEDSVLITQLLAKHEVCNLAQIIEANLKHYCIHLDPLVQKYSRTLHTIAGLGFTAVLVNDDLVENYKLNLDTFFKYRAFQKNSDALPMLSMAMAEMISLARGSFLRLEHPNYQQDFIISVEEALDNVFSTMSGRRRKALDLLDIITALL